MSDLEQRYTDACDTPSDIYLHLPKFVDMVDEMGATTVVELGTRSGVSTVAWLYALERFGTLTSVDIDPAPDIGTYPHWQFVQGDDCSLEVFDQIPDNVDIVFIDTSHDHTHTLRELNLYRWKVRPGGRIVLHDTELAHPENVTGPAFPVKKAVVEFCAENGFEWHNDPECFGLGTIFLP